MTDMGRVRFEGGEWERRPARSAVLIAPGNKWIQEDDYGPGDSVASDEMRYSAWMIVNCPKSKVFAPFLRGQMSYAMFDDGKGSLVPLLDEAQHFARESGDRGFWCAQASLFRLLDELQSFHWHEQDRIWRRDVPASESLSIRVDRLLEQRLAETIRLVDVADAIGVSVSTLSHRYRELTGYSPMDRLIRMRVDHARQLLMQGKRVTDIAVETGFVDASHLSRTFKRTIGMSPRRFIESWRAGYAAV